jgi:hypothetical protein
MLSISRILGSGLVKYVRESQFTQTDAAGRSVPPSKHRMAVDSGRLGLNLFLVLFLSAGSIPTTALAVDVDLDNGTTYNPDAGRHYWTFKNPDNNTKRPDVTVQMRMITVVREQKTWVRPRHCILSQVNHHWCMCLGGAPSNIKP